MVSPHKLVPPGSLQHRFSIPTMQCHEGENQLIPSQHTEGPSWVTSELLSYITLGFLIWGQVIQRYNNVEEQEMEKGSHH